MIAVRQAAQVQLPSTGVPSALIGQEAGRLIDGWLGQLLQIQIKRRGAVGRHIHRALSRPLCADQTVTDAFAALAVEAERKRLEISDRTVLSVDRRTLLSYFPVINSKDGGMNASQFARWLKDQGITIRDKKAHGHKILINPANGRTSELPMHGGSKQLGTGLTQKIKKDLGLK